MKEYIAEYIVPVEKKGKDCMLEFFNTKPLIRCKDCKYNPKRSLVGCPMAGCMSRTDEWYCPVGKPK
jgi:hypothetical protein